MTAAEALDNLARIAYRSYGETTDFKNFQGNPMPEWEDLPPKIQEAWRGAARAVAVSVALRVTDRVRDSVRDVVRDLVPTSLETPVSPVDPGESLPSQSSAETGHT